MDQFDFIFRPPPPALLFFRRRTAVNEKSIRAMIIQSFRYVPARSHWQMNRPPGIRAHWSVKQGLLPGHIEIWGAGGVETDLTMAWLTGGAYRRRQLVERGRRREKHTQAFVPWRRRKALRVNERCVSFFPSLRGFFPRGSLKSAFYDFYRNNLGKVWGRIG